MKTDADRLEDLYKATSEARGRVMEAKRAFDDLGVVVRSAHHLEVALRQLGAGGAPAIDDVRVLVNAMRELEETVAAAGLDEALVRSLERARRRVTRAANAFLVDTQPI